MRTSYHELPSVFGFMSSMPPPALRIYIMEASPPEWSGHDERVQQLYTNIQVPNHVRFTIYPERRFHPEKHHTNTQLYLHDRNPRIVYNMEWWFTGFYLQNTSHNRDLQDIPILDFDTNLLQDLLFEQSRPVSLMNLHASDDMYRTILNRRFEICTMYPYNNEPHYNNNTGVRRRLSFSLRDLDNSRNSRVITPPRRRNNDYYDNALMPPPPPRTRDSINVIRRPRNIIIDPPTTSAPAPSPTFQLPKFVIEAVMKSNIQNENNCSITMIPFKDIAEVSLTNCFHCFEKEALAKWMDEKQTCPECRTNITGVIHHTMESV
jgi:hypothetical protein